MFCTLENVRIAGLRTAVPANEICIDDELEYYGGSAKKVARLKATLGMDRRRVCPPDVTASDLCAHAARDLLAAFPESKSAIDALIFVSQSPDWHQPATACELQNRLGLSTSCAAFDVNQGCAGYIYGLWIASAMIASGAARKALLLVGDAHPRGRDARNRIISPVFGDAGSATLLVRDDTASPLHFGLGTDGSGFEAVIIPACCARIPPLRNTTQNIVLSEDNTDSFGNTWQLDDTWMDGAAIFNFTMDVVPAHLRDVLAYAHSSPDAIDWLILHQANKQIVENVALKSGFPIEKAPSQAFSKYGNAASASIPLALCDGFSENLTPSSGNFLLCGFGVGLAWGSCLCSIEDLDCKAPLDFVPDPKRPTRQQRIEYWQKKFRGEGALP